jgi:hypothetical protein
MARLGSMVVKGKLPTASRDQSCWVGDVREVEAQTGWRTYFGGGVGEAVKGGGFAGRGLADEGDEGVAAHRLLHIWSHEAILQAGMDGLIDISTKN